ncbi:MAG: class I SAM-dependent methyltransferase [Caldilineaceae bacterium]|nr:class I SAM-dependent methyltransferase [Caldilineaceae bacterium]
MPTQVNHELGHVQKTLLLPLWGRAVETKKRRPLLVDATAARIVEQLPLDFAPIAAKMDPLSQLAWVKRSVIGDQVITRFLARHPAGAIVNIGCGLDTTFDRVDNGQVRWYDLDLPDVIALRRRFIPETARRTLIAASFLDEGWLHTIDVTDNVLFLAAGVFYYFQAEVVKAFVLRLLAAYPGGELLFDVSSPIGVRVANKRVIADAGLDERSALVWGLANKRDLLAWDPRLHLLGTHYYFRSLRIGLRNLVMGTLSDFLGIQYMIHLRLGQHTT